VYFSKRNAVIVQPLGHESTKRRKRNEGVRFRPALVRYDGFALFAARDPNIFLYSRFIQG